MSCQICKHKFVQDDPCYVVNNDGEFDFTKIVGIDSDYESFLLCPSCYDKVCIWYPDFAEWWQANTAILDVPDDEMDASDWSERDYCSYFTTYNKEEDGSQTEDQD